MERLEMLVWTWISLNPWSVLSRFMPDFYIVLIISSVEPWTRGTQASLDSGTRVPRCRTRAWFSLQVGDWWIRRVAGTLMASLKTGANLEEEASTRLKKVTHVMWYHSDPLSDLIVHVTVTTPFFFAFIPFFSSLLSQCLVSLLQRWTLTHINDAYASKVLIFYSYHHPT